MYGKGILKFKITTQFVLVLIITTTLIGCNKNTEKTSEQIKVESIAPSIELDNATNKDIQSEVVEEIETKEIVEEIKLKESIEHEVKELNTESDTELHHIEIEESIGQEIEEQNKIDNTQEDIKEEHKQTEDKPEIEKHIHIYKTIKQEPTCEEQGIVKKVCKKCGNIKSTKIIEAKGHKEKTIKGYAETCTSDGLTDGLVCKTCNKIIVKQEIIKGGHISLKDKGKSKTCTSDGLTDGEHCGRCNKILVEQKIIPKGHNLKHIEGINKTCTTNGYTEGNKCLDCDYTDGLEEIKATGHVESILTGKEATCLEDGITEGKKCSVCGEILVAQEIIKATGHKEITLEGVEPTCTETGLTEGKKCENCGEILVAQTEIPATDISIWDKQSLSEPSIIDGYLVINFAEELAWVSKYQNTKGVDKIKLGHTIDMANETVESLPNNIEEIDGNNKRLENIKLTDSGLIKNNENTKNLSIYNLTISNCKVENYTATGIIIGTFKGNANLSNITIKDSVVTSKEDYTGGIIGEYNSQENQEIIAENISIHNTKIDGCLGSGKLVGLYEGYTTNEVIKVNNFNEENIELASITDKFNMNSQSCFLNALDTKYNNIISNSKYYRGKLILDELEFILKWDGKTAVEPIKNNEVYEIYTPFDLAGLREISENIDKVEIKSSIDMNGQGNDGIYNINKLFKQSTQESTDDNNFKPFNRINYLSGNNNTIYNLKIEQIEKEAGAFILGASGTTEHKDIIFNNCCTVVTHKQVNSDAKAYGAILIANATGNKYTVSNIKINNCKVFALQKVGLLVGCLNTKDGEISNCSIKNSYIENYECNISERFDSGNKTFQNRTVRLYADFYPQGEIGSLVGFVTKNAKIHDNKVTSCKLYCYGQDDKMATVTGSTLGQLAIAMAGYYKVPGRHVGSLIGDIRAVGNIEINNNLVDNVQLLNRKDCHNTGIAKEIGQAYYVKFLDTMGTAYINGNKLTLADCNTDTVR